MAEQQLPPATDAACRFVAHAVNPTSVADLGGDLVAQDDHGSTPLHLAARDDDTGEMVEWLIDFGADVAAVFSVMQLTVLVIHVNTACADQPRDRLAAGGIAAAFALGGGGGGGDVDVVGVPNGVVVLHHLDRFVILVVGRRESALDAAENQEADDRNAEEDGDDDASDGTTA